MRASFALLAAAFAAASFVPAASTAQAETLNAEAAKTFVAGRTFSYSCYDGSVGSGRIQADGSVAGTIRLRGQGAARYVALPAGTLKAKNEAICAKLRGVAFEPCFDVEKTSASTFRGNLAGFDRLWCEFASGGSGRAKMASRRGKAETTTAQVEARN